MKIKNRCRKSIAKTAGLESNLYVGIGSRVMLKKNRSSVLVNGSLGTVRNIIYDKNRKDYVDYLEVKFDHIDDLITIKRIVLDYEYQKKVYVSRAQFPLSLAWALTIHKTQGMSLDCAIIDVGTNIFEAGMSYVALSRIKKLENVHLIAFEPNTLKCDELSVLEYNRLHAKFNQGSYIKKYQAWARNTRAYKFKKDLVTPQEIRELSEASNSKLNKDSALLPKKNILYGLPKKNNTMAPRVDSKRLNTSASAHCNDKYFLKLTNTSNACFTNVIVQAMISLGDEFYQLVIKFSPLVIIIDTFLLISVALLI